MRGNGMIAARYEPYSAHINPFLLVDSYIQTAKRLGAGGMYLYQGAGP